MALLYAKRKNTQKNRCSDSATCKAGFTSATECYLAHVEEGRSIRSIATQLGVHPSTVLRRIRRVEVKRDDPMVDSFLTEQAGRHPEQRNTIKGETRMKRPLHEWPFAVIF
ncbi:MAG: PucR family transcriptional regulator [Rhodobacteraceae bacterium]|nr:PucR family transcriptional regulator [Paracoccaceae bacterium]